MRSNKEQLERLRIKSELGQKIIVYQQTKTTEKQEEEKQKFILKQQIMEDILRKKYKPDEQNIQHKIQAKGDSKLYSFGFPNHVSSQDNNQYNQDSYASNPKQNETSMAQEQSSMPYISANRNKYVIPDKENKSQTSYNGHHFNHEPSPRQQQESNNYDEESKSEQDNELQSQRSQNHSIKYFDKQIPSNSYTFQDNRSQNLYEENKSHQFQYNKSNKYSIQNRSNSRYDINQKSQHLSNVQANEFSDFGSFGKYTNPITFLTAQDLSDKNKEKQKSETMSYSKYLQSNVFNKPQQLKKSTYKQEYYEQKEQQSPVILNQIDQKAYNLSKQYMKNKSGWNNSSKDFANNDSKQLSSDRMYLPPKPEKKYQKQQNKKEPPPVYKHQYLQEDHEEINEEQTDNNNQKAYGGFIKEGQYDDDYLEQLRKQKIMKLEKKRLERSEERKKSQQLSSIRLEKSSNIIENQRKQSYGNLYKKEKPRKTQEYYNNDTSLRLPPLLPEKKTVQPKSRTSSEAEHTRSSGFDKTSQRQRKSSPHQGSSIQSSSSKGLLKTPKSSSVFQLSPNRPKDKSLSKLFQDPKIQPKQRKQTFNKQSNKKMMMNAVTNVCFPGEINRKQREKLLQVLQNSSHQYFIFLFKQYSRNVVKGVYTYDSSSGSVIKVYGQKSPQQIHQEDVSKFYRFDSGAKEFKVLDGCKSFSYAVHAIYIK